MLHRSDSDTIIIIIVNIIVIIIVNIIIIMRFCYKEPEVGGFTRQMVLENLLRNARTLEMIAVCEYGMEVHECLHLNHYMKAVNYLTWSTGDNAPPLRWVCLFKAVHCGGDLPFG